MLELGKKLYQRLYRIDKGLRQSQADDFNGLISNSFENSLHFWALKSFFLDNYLFFLLGVAFLHILWQKVINFESLNAQL